MIFHPRLCWRAGKTELPLNPHYHNEMHIFICHEHVHVSTVSMYTIYTVNLRLESDFCVKVKPLARNLDGLQQNMEHQSGKSASIQQFTFVERRVDLTI